MSQLSDYLENALLTHIFRNTDFSRPASAYVSLHTAALLDDGSGAEVSGGSYARQGVATGAGSGWSAPASEGAGDSDGYYTENSADITFPTATADWGTVTHVGLWDAVSGGNLLFRGQLTTSKNVLNGDTFKFPAGALHAILR